MQPKLKRLDSAPVPSLTGPATSLLQNFLGDPQAALARLQPTSSLQQSFGNTLEQLLSGQKPGQATTGAAAQIQELLGGSPGKGILDALTPLFSRNLGEANANLAQFGGPRFASQTLNAQRQLSERALGDFNLFGQQVMENAVGRNLGFLQNLLGQAGQYSLGQQGQQGQLLAQLLSGAFTGGGVNAPAQYMQTPSLLGQLGSLVGAVAPFALGGLGGGGGNLIGSTIGNPTNSGALVDQLFRTPGALGPRANF